MKQCYSSVSCHQYSSHAFHPFFRVVQNADLAAVIMQEGLAFVCLITSSMTVDRAKIDVNIPKKGKADDTQRKKVRQTTVVLVGLIIFSEECNISGILLYMLACLSNHNHKTNIELSS